MPWQEQVADVIGEYEGTRPAYREAVVSVPRQSGKTTLLLVLMLDRALMRGKPQRIAYTAQTGQDAHSKVIDDIWEQQIEPSPFRHAVKQVKRGIAETAIQFKNGSRIDVLRTTKETGHGKSVDLAIIDEAFADEDDRREQGLLPAMATRADAQLLVFSTMGTGASTYFNAKVATGRAAVDNGVTDSIAYFEWSASPGTDPDDAERWGEYMPALGHTIDASVVAHARGSMPEGSFRRAYMNLQTASREAWLPYGVWDEARDDRRVVAPGEAVVLGFDGAWTGDSVALVGCTVSKPHHLFVVDSWQPTDGEPVSADEIEARIDEAAHTWDVREIAADPHEWRRELQEWAKRWRVNEWPTNSLSRMVPACAEFYQAVVGQQITHDGDVRLARHIGNAVVKTDRYGPRIVKNSNIEKIDLAVAAVIAYDRAQSVKPKRHAMLAGF